ncbi:hypothetical protein BGW80DRAFT_861313 [Lactifluus volemus]|nr:hypothetical protein BGW80DRAFT_861313 [Lactifluus volemus]
MCIMVHDYEYLVISLFLSTRASAQLPFAGVDSSFLVHAHHISQAIDRLANFSLCYAYCNVPSASTHLLLTTPRAQYPRATPGAVPRSIYLFGMCHYTSRASYVSIRHFTCSCLVYIFFPALVYLQLSSDLPLLFVVTPSTYLHSFSYSVGL